MKEKNIELSFTLKIIFVLYLLVGLSHVFLREIEAFQWLYLSVLNFLTLIVCYKKGINNISFTKSKSIFTLVFIIIIIISLLSIFKSLYISESLVHISRFITLFISFICLSLIVKDSPLYFFELLCKVFLLIVLFDASKAFLDLKLERTTELLHFFKRKHGYGNRNVYTAAIITKLPFVFFLFFNKNKIWKTLSYIVTFLSFFALIYVGSRTALLSAVIIFFLFTGYNLVIFFKHKSNNNLYAIITMILVPVFSIILFKNTNKVYKTKLNSISQIGEFKQKDHKKVRNFKLDNPNLVSSKIKINEDKNEELNTITKIIKEKGSGRYEIWQSALTLFSENPFLGVGYGHFKLSSRQTYLDTLKHSTFQFAIRVHNDFLEKFAETGIVGGITYLLLFLILLFRIIKNMRSINSSNLKTVHFILLLSFITYVVDAFFNFPLERAPIAFIFVLISAFSFDFSTDQITIFNTKKGGYITLTIISLLVLASNSLVFKRYYNCAHYIADFRNKSLRYSYDNVKSSMFDYPTLSSKGQNSNYFLMLYAFRENKNDEVKNLLKSSTPKTFIDTILFNEVKCNIYNKTNKKDSVEHYVKSTFKIFPLPASYNILKSIYKKDNDTIKHLDLMNFYLNKKPRNEKEWIEKVDLIYLKTKDIDKAIMTLDTAIYYNTNSYRLLKRKKSLLDYKKGLEVAKTKESNLFTEKINKLFSQNKFEKIKPLLLNYLKKHPEDYHSILNLGIVEMRLKNYERSITHLTKVIKRNAFNDGKAEFCRGVCLEKIGDTINAKKDYITSRKKGFPAALKLPFYKIE